MALKDNELGRRAAGATELRPEAMPVRWVFADLPSADAHSLDCRFGCSLRIADNPADRSMFAEVFLAGRDSATTEQITDHFVRPLRAALAALAAQSNAADAVAMPQSPKWIAALTKAAQPLAFASGLELLPPFQLDVESPTLQRQRIEEIARTRAAERTAGQLQHLEHATCLLKQFHALRQSAPDLPVGKLLEQIGPADRGTTLEALLLASSGQGTAANLWAVAGAFLVKIDPRSAPPGTKIVELPTTLGPLRSVQPGLIDGQKMLLIGARSGVMAVSPENPAEQRLWAHPGIDSALGFNRVVCSDRWIWASHGDAGIVGWKLAEMAVPAATFAERATTAEPQPGDWHASIVRASLSPRVGTAPAPRAAGPRNLQLLHQSRLIYSVGNQLIVRAGESRIALPAHSPTDIIAIVPSPRMMVGVHQDGTIVLTDRVSGQIADVRRRGAWLSAAGAMPWLGDMRLLLACDEGAIDCVGPDDAMVSEYLGPYRSMKIVCGAADSVAGVSSDRQRIVFWHAWEGRKPTAELHLTSLVRHRIADIEFDA